MAFSDEDRQSIREEIGAAFKDVVWKITVEQPNIYQPKNEGVGELEKLQFDYAWKWFAYHADQRIKMFNYMLLAVGIFANAIVAAINNGYARTAGFSCFIALVLLIAFALLDWRNGYLVGLGQNLLLKLENGALFAKKLTGQGIIQLKDSKKAQKIAAHRFWLPIVTLGLALAFAISGYWLLYHSTEFTKPAPVIKVPDSLSVKVPGSLSVRLLLPPPTSQPGTTPGKSNSSSGARVKKRTRVSP